MKLKIGILDLASAVLVGISAVLLAIALSLPRIPGDTGLAATRMQKSLEKRLAVLENAVQHPERDIPDDMVVYRYDEDTLTRWRNQFPVTNDDIVDRVMFQRLLNPRVASHSPLSEIGEQYAFHNFGSKWYLARKIQDGETTAYLIGLEVMDSRAGSFNGVNPRLRLGDKFSIRPLSFSGGSDVSINCVPQFKVLYESMGSGTLPANAAYVWLAFGFFLCGLLLFLRSKKTAGRFAIAVTGIVLSHFAMHMWGHTAQNYHIIFSPALFAGGEFFCSLGAVIIFNLFILLLVLCFYMTRDTVGVRIRKRMGPVLSSAAAVLAVLGILAYTVVSIRSIVLNSNISLELYKLPTLSVYSLLVYVSFLMMLVSIPMILKMRFGRLPVGFRLALASVIALFLVLFAAVFGFHKELARTEMAADKVAVGRDVYMELQLRRVENQIASDMVVSTLSALDNTAATICNRITDSYLSRISQDYDVSVFLVHDSDATPQAAAIFNDRLRSGEAIAPSSRFLYSETANGPRYDGIFLYYNDVYGLSRLLLEVERKYGAAGLRRFSLPSFYSYAMYKEGRLQTFRGDFAYPTDLSAGVESGVKDRFRHFVYEVADGETVVISRPRNGVLNFIIAFIFLALIEFLLLSLVTAGERSAVSPVREYYKTRLSWVIMISLTLTLVAMASVSVLFVYRLNNSNISTIMSEKAGAMQSLVQNAVKGVRSTDDLLSAEGRSLIETVASNTGTEFTLYRPDGKMLLTTSPEPQWAQPSGCRIDENAYESIVRQKKRFFFQKERRAERRIFGMYAPVFGEDGRMVAVLRSPYTGSETYSFDREAVMHSMTIVTVFLILLILARFSVVSVLGRMLKPLSMMGRKMSSANLGSLDLLQYDRDDEISPLVQAYNRMVTELSESSRQLAQAERDKAWSSMARQVAHEIKNPLTPMKLQLQRIMRLKQKDAPDWQNKFDEVAEVLLDHIDILTDTANEFSTFAKLYSEEPTCIDLDKVLQEEISMFDNKERVEFSYFGLSDVKVMAPKPQLIRVFVNLINNAVQAVEGNAGGGEIRVSLRKSVDDGYYDIVFEDNGPGVSEENVDRLFTPNFTTKNGGTGLGLAISRSVLERCGATIAYSKSFSLGGACFTIRYPKELSSRTA